MNVSSCRFCTSILVCFAASLLFGDCFGQIAGQESDPVASSPAPTQELEIAVRPPEAEKPAQVLLVGYLVNHDTAAFSLGEFPENKDIRVFAAASSDPDKLKQFSSAPYPYFNSWYLLKSGAVKKGSNPQTVVIEPGQRRRVLSIPIEDLYDQTKWKWNWRSHMMYKSDPSSSDVSIWFNFKRIQSNPVQWKIDHLMEPKLTDSNEPKKTSNSQAIPSRMIQLTTDQSEVWKVQKGQNGIVIETKCNEAADVSFPVAKEHQDLINQLFQLAESSVGDASKAAIHFRSSRQR